jgi:hypothetical protein
MRIDRFASVSAVSVFAFLSFSFLPVREVLSVPILFQENQSMNGSQRRFLRSSDRSSSCAALLDALCFSVDLELCIEENVTAECLPPAEEARKEEGQQAIFSFFFQAPCSSQESEREKCDGTFFCFLPFFLSASFFPSFSFFHFFVCIIRCFFFSSCLSFLSSVSPQNLSITIFWFFAAYFGLFSFLPLFSSLSHIPINSAHAQHEKDKN